MAEFLSLHTGSNSAHSSARTYIALTCTMPAKFFLLHKPIPRMKACCFFLITVFLWSLCLLKNMVKQFQRQLACRMLKLGKIMPLLSAQMRDCGGIFWAILYTLLHLNPSASK